MLKHNLRIAIRRLFRNPLNTFITVFGLSTGFASFIILFHFTTYEFSFDTFHRNKDEIYRVANLPKKGVATARNYNALGMLIRDQFPEVEQVVRFWKVWNRNDGDALKAKGQIHYEQNLIQSDPSFFLVFPSLLKQGNPETVLSDPNSIVISESKAKAYFQEEEPIGQVVSDGTQDLKVTGIMYDIPKNSHFNINIIRTFYDDFFLQENWGGQHLYTYITVDPTTDIKALKQKLEATVRAKQNEFEHLMNASFELQRITDIHLNSNLDRELSANSDKTLIYFLLAIGVVILIMAWINHMNLSMSSFFSRAKELSIRGVVGADRSNLSHQLLMEYLLLNSLTVPISILLIVLSGQFLDEQGLIPDITEGLYSPWIWTGIFSFLIIGSILTGLFPSLLIRKIRFSTELKTRSNHSVSGTGFRSTLVIIQFAAAMILVSGVVIMGLQLKHLKSGNKNMEIDQIIAIRNPTAYAEFDSDDEEVKDYTLFKEQLTAHTEIEWVASSSAIPGSQVGFGATDLLKRNKEDPSDPTPLKLIFVDSDFLDVYSIPLLAGRSFSELVAQDIGQKSIMLSEEAIRHLGFLSPELAIDQPIDFYLWAAWKSYRIIGVFKDYSHESAKSQPFPTVLYFNRYESYIMHHLYHSIKIAKHANIDNALTHIQNTWATVWPEKPFEYYFIDQVYEAQYQPEKVLSTTFTFFSIVAIVLACLGIIGITHYELQARLREISVRKVLGSTIMDIIRLFSTKYLLLIFISTFLSIPITLWLAGRWLEDYPIKITLSFWIFLIPVGLILGLVFLTSGSIIYKSASANPAKVLRSE